MSRIVTKLELNLKCYTIVDININFKKIINVSSVELFHKEFKIVKYLLCNIHAVGTKSGRSGRKLSKTKKKCQCNFLFIITK